MTKAIFFDIDGTLVPFGTGCIPPDTRQAIAEARKKGIKVFISTGRHIEWVDNLGDTEFDGYVTVNGSTCLLADKKTCIYERSIPRDDLERLCAFCHCHEMPIGVMPAEGGLFMTRIDDTVREVARQLKVPETPVEPIERVLDGNVAQLMAFAPESEREESGLMTEVLTGCDATSWNPIFCDIVPHGSDKGIGIRKMAEHFGITPEETMAFGDGGNDIAMLKAAGTGVAMGNAADDVKRAADYVTAAADDGGVAKAFRHFGII